MALKTLQIIDHTKASGDTEGIDKCPKCQRNGKVHVVKPKNKPLITEYIHKSKIVDLMGLAVNEITDMCVVH